MVTTTRNSLIFSFIFAFLVSCLIPGDVECQRGCCSHHGGVCGNQCCDGTPLSAKCRGGASSSAPVQRRSYIPATPSHGATQSGQSSVPASTRVPESELARIIYLKDGRKIIVKSAWEENGQIKCVLLYGAAIICPKETVGKIESVDKQQYERLYPLRSQLKERGKELLKENTELKTLKVSLAEEAKNLDGPLATGRHEEKISQLNVRLSAYEMKRKAYQKDLDAFVSKVIKRQ